MRFGCDNIKKLTRKRTADVPCKLNNEIAKDEPEILERIILQVSQSVALSAL